MKHVVIGPKRGYINSSDLGIAGGDGPNTKSIIGDATAKMGAVTNVRVSEFAKKLLYNRVCWSSIPQLILFELNYIDWIMLIWFLEHKIHCL